MSGLKPFEHGAPSSLVKAFTLRLLVKKNLGGEGGGTGLLEECQDTSTLKVMRYLFSEYVHVNVLYLGTAFRWLVHNTPVIMVDYANHTQRLTWWCWHVA